MKIVPNPADGLAQAVGDALHKGMGFGKNTIDFISVLITCGIGTSGRNRSGYRVCNDRRRPCDCTI